MVWSEEMRWQYVKEHGYEVLDSIPEGWKLLKGSCEPKPYGLEWICCGSRFDGKNTYRKALVRA